MKSHSCNIAALILVTMLLCSVLFCACSFSNTVSLPNTPSTTITPTPSLPPTLAPSPLPTATPLMNAEEAAYMNQQFHDFLNKSGEFTEEKLASIILDVDLESDEVVRLGLTDSIPRIQGYIFGCMDIGDYIILLVGFDGADGNRFITPIEIPAYFFDFIQKRAFRVDQFSRNYIGDWFFEGTSKTAILYSRGELNSFFTEHSKRVMGLDICKQKFEIDDRIKGLGEVAITYVNNLNARTDLTYGLYELVDSNGFKYDIPEGIKSTCENIFRITSVNDISQIDNLKMPEVFSVCYYEG